MIQKRYPQGKKKAFHISFDDGILQDIGFVELLNRFGVKGTFHLNYQLMCDEFQWIHESGLPIKRLSPQAALEVYAGHEVASHSLTHPSLDHLGEEEVMYELGHDKWCLSQLFGCEIGGFGVPFDYYDDTIAHCAKKLGFEYVRTSEESYSYKPPEDPYYWAAGTYHVMPGFFDFVEGFFSTEEELALCQIVGHSYDLDVLHRWEYMESLLHRVSEDPDIISMTNLELVRYLNAMKCAKITEESIENQSQQRLWFDLDGVIVSVGPGETLER